VQEEDTERWPQPVEHSCRTSLLVCTRSSMSYHALRRPGQHGAGISRVFAAAQELARLESQMLAARASRSVSVCTCFGTTGPCWTNQSCGCVHQPGPTDAPVRTGNPAHRRKADTSQSLTRHACRPTTEKPCPGTSQLIGDLSTVISAYAAARGKPSPKAWRVQWVTGLSWSGISSKGGTEHDDVGRQLLALGQVTVGGW